MISIKKRQFLLITSIYFILASALYIVKTGYYAVILLAMIATVWYVFLGLYRGYEGVVRKIMFLTLYMVSSLTILLFFPNLSIYPKILFIAGTALLSYAEMLSLNVYIVVDKQQENIPLLQPAKVVSFTTFLVTAFLGTTTLYKVVLISSYPLANLVVMGSAFVLFYVALIGFFDWFLAKDIMVEEGREDVIRRLVIFTIVSISQLSLVLVFFSFEAFGRAVIITGALYVMINIIQNYLLHKLNIRFVIESAIVLIFVYIIVLFL